MTVRGQLSWDRQALYRHIQVHSQGRAIDSLRHETTEMAVKLSNCVTREELQHVKTMEERLRAAFGEDIEQLKKQALGGLAKLADTKAEREVVDRCAYDCLCHGCHCDRCHRHCYHCQYCHHPRIQQPIAELVAGVSCGCATPMQTRERYSPLSA